VVAVLHNDDLNQVTWELRAMGGSPTFPPSQSLPSVPYAAFAEQVGLLGRVVDDPEELGGAWEMALDAKRPVVLDVHVDPDVPPIPPHATFEQVKETATALIRGDEERWGVVREGLRTKAREVLHRSHR
jgi:pyruvate dehydrogenase (quinone)